MECRECRRLRLKYDDCNGKPWYLQKLALVIKQRLKLLNALLHNWNKPNVSFFRKGFQIYGTIVVFNAIQMVNNPTLGNWLPMSLLPNKNVIEDISISIGSRMFTFKDINVASAGFDPSTLPRMVSFPSGRAKFMCLRYCSVGQASLPEYLIYCRSCTSNTIAHLKTNFSARKPFFPIQSKKFLAGNFVTYRDTATHIINYTVI